MRTRNLMKALLPLLLLLMSIGLGTASAEAPRRPNFLFIAVDDLRPEMACYGVPGVETPALNALAAEGVVFDRAYCQVAVCGASRSSLMTGLRPTSHRFLTYHARVDEDAPRAATLQRTLRDGGYKTISLGKVYHFADDRAADWSRPPWRHPHDFPGYGAHENTPSIGDKPVTEAADLPDAVYPDAQLTNQAIEELANLQAEGAPFILAVGYSKPHLPFACPKKYWDLYDDPDRIPQAAARMKPAGAPAYAVTDSGEVRFYGDMPGGPAPLDEAMQLRLKHGYWACVSFIDHQIGRLLAALEREGLRENTVVILWGDHGWHLGDLGMWGKSTNYEYGTRVPLIIRHPDRVSGAETDAIVELLDLYPSICDWAGVEPPAGIAGESLDAILKRPDLGHEGVACSQYVRGDKIGFTIRTDRYRYVEWQDRASAAVLARELYDYEQDPLETRNLAAEPDQQECVRQLAERLHAENATEYEPVLPKCCPTEKVIVLDIAQDLKNGGGVKFTESHDMVYTLCALQGLANRDNPVKVYFENVPTRIFYDQNDGGPGNATREFLEDGLIPYPLERVELDAEEKYPSLLWMLEHYGDRIKGLVTVPGIHGPEHVVPPIAGARAAGINACTFESLLPVSPVLHRYIIEKGFDLPLVDDYRHMGNTEALDYSIRRWIDHPRRNRRMIGHVSEYASHGNCMSDYFVSTGVFCYFLNHREKDPQPVVSDPPEWHDKLLRDAYYPQGTVIFGSVELPHAIPYMQRLGYTCVEGLMSNASVTSSIPTRPERFQAARPPRVLELDPKNLYLAFHGNDGDAIDFCVYISTKNFRNDPAADEMPMGWKVNPYVIDLFPTLFEWYTKRHPDIVDLIPSMNDGGPSQTVAGQAYWGDVYRRYYRAANGAFQTLHVFGAVASGGPSDQVETFPHVYRMYGYQNGRPDITWIEEDGVVRSDFVGSAFSTVEQLADLIERTAERDFSDEEPAFIFARIGYDASREINVRRGTLPASMATWTVEALKNDGDLDRNIVLCRPSDLAVTWKAWKDRRAAQK